MSMKYVAQTLSYLLHPFLMPLYAVYFIFNVDSVFSLVPTLPRIYCYCITALVLLVIPLLSLPILKHFRLITNYGLDSRQERVYPILVAVIFSFLGFWLMGRIPYANIVQQLYLVLIILLSAFSIVTLRWKMSMHMTAMGAVCGFLFILGMKYWGDVRNLLILMLILSGILASCRLYLGKHTPLQVYIGFLFGLGFIIGILY